MRLVCLEQLGDKRAGCGMVIWWVPTLVKSGPMDGFRAVIFWEGLCSGLDSCNGYGLSVWIMAGSALGHAKDSIDRCGLLSGGGAVAWGVWRIFLFFDFCFF